jgi:hypothetical protein
MKKRPVNYLDFEVDKLTRSVENAVTGDSFATEVLYFTKDDVKQVTKKSGWEFTWAKEFAEDDREVYKLTIINNPGIIQGLMSLRIEKDHIYMPLIESAPFNKGKSKMYVGVPGNLIAYACRFAFQKGFEGFISFHSKTKLIGHYEKTLDAYHFGGHLMIINTAAAKALVEKYFKS